MSEYTQCPKSGFALYAFDGMPNTEQWPARCDCGAIIMIQRHAIIPRHQRGESDPDAVLVARANAYANGKGEDLDRLLHSEGSVEPQQKEGK